MSIHDLKTRMADVAGIEALTMGLGLPILQRDGRLPFINHPALGLLRGNIRSWTCRI
jgi:hypothetical protein